MKRSTERRDSVRITARLAMEVKLGGKSSTRLETINVSANGVYFSSPVFIPPLTKLSITLLLPRASDGAPGPGRHVACEGVVVRTDPETERPGRDRYEIACYFTSIPDQDKQVLDSYILRQIPL